jgi:hypothetical protein
VKGSTKLHEAGGTMKQVEDMRKELQNILVTCNGSENIYGHFLFHHFFLFLHIHANDMNQCHF